MEIKVPALGESVTSATVARWLKQAGKSVAADEPLVELETDKVTVEVNAPEAGVLSTDQRRAGSRGGSGFAAGDAGSRRGGSCAETGTGRRAATDGTRSAARPTGAGSSCGRQSTARRQPAAASDRTGLAPGHPAG